jgi:hypothetical protein
MVASWTRTCVMSALWLTALLVRGEAAGPDGTDRPMISVLTNADLGKDAFECDCEFARGEDVIGNTVFATRRHRGVALVKIDGAVMRLTPVHVSSPDCRKGATHAEEWRGSGLRVMLQLRPSGTGEEACWYRGRMAVETTHRSEAIAISGSCGC